MTESKSEFSMLDRPRRPAPALIDGGYDTPVRGAKLWPVGKPFPAGKPEFLSRRGGKQFAEQGAIFPVGRFSHRGDRPVTANCPMLGRDTYSRQRGHCPNVPEGAHLPA
jgi:hypothetical protein